MKKSVVSLLFVVLLAAGCGSAKMDISIEETPEFKNGTPSEMILKVMDDDIRIEGLSIVATLEMAKMDHGVIEVQFEDIGEGLYSAQVELPMGGEWIADVEVESEGEQTKEVLTFDVKER
ncbi:FixH family protein [Saccharococcus sp. Marseille-Q5394]|uniref:FixH family protein n=1 Tax=Saccharococcus sp. Marseille-Q5394 TaxID=2972778 RepID=UPI0021C7D330|nr:FixH family protein [Saccharococcus sp. Marseille-Q5394]